MIGDPIRDRCSELSDESASLLAQSGLVSDRDMRSALSLREIQGGTLPENLVLAGAVDDETLTEFYRRRLLVNRIDPDALVGIAPEVIERVPRELAIDLRAVPVTLGNDGNVIVIFSDPADDRGVQELSYQTGINVVRAVATQLQLAWSLGHYYEHLTTLGERLIEDAPEPAAPRERRRGLTGEVRSRRRDVLPPVAGDSEEADPAWIAARAEAYKAGTENAPETIPVTDAPAHLSASGRIPNSTALRSQHGELEIASDDSDLADGEEPTIVVAKQRAGTEGEVTAVYAAESLAKTPSRSNFEFGADDETLPRATPGEEDEAEAPTAVRDAFLDDDTAIRDAPRRPLSDEDLRPLVEEISAEMNSAVRASDAMDFRETSKIVRALTEDGDADSEFDTRSTARLPRGSGVPELIDGTDSRPILLTNERTPKADAVLLLENPRRDARRTAVGIGRAGRLTSRPPGASAPRGETPDPNLRYSGHPSGDAVPDSVANETQTRPVSKKKRKKRTREQAAVAAEPRERSLPRSTLSSVVDDGWGDEDFEVPVARAKRASATPAPAAEAAPEPAAEEAPAKATGKNGKASRNKRKTTPPTSADAERLTQTVKELSQTDDRNAVFDLLMDFLSGTHQRVAFFAVKKGKVCAWKHKGLESADAKAEVELGASSTLNAVVQGGAPFQGTDLDPATHDFLTKATGNAPEDIIAAPVAIGPRVIGVLYGDGPKGTLFDQQVQMVTRTAGMALQRILSAAKK